MARGEKQLASRWPHRPSACSMLREMCEKYRFRTITIEQFRELAQQFSAPKSADPDLKIFFDYWIYGTGIPTVKMTTWPGGTRSREL
jgi:hypothetical protein